MVIFLKARTTFESYLRLFPGVPQARLTRRAPLLRGGFLGVEVDAVRGAITGEEAAALVTQHWKKNTFHFIFIQVEGQT